MEEGKVRIKELKRRRRENGRRRRWERTAIIQALDHGEQVHALVLVDLADDEVGEIIVLERSGIESFGQSFLVQYIFHVFGEREGPSTLWHCIYGLRLGWQIGHLPFSGKKKRSAIFYKGRDDKKETIDLGMVGVVVVCARPSSSWDGSSAGWACDGRGRCQAGGVVRGH